MKIKNTREWMKDMFELGFGWGILYFILIMILLFGLFCLEAAIGVWLWGIIMVGVFGLPSLTFWQFIGLQILIYILFPSMGGKVE